MKNSHLFIMATLVGMTLSASAQTNLNRAAENPAAISNSSPATSAETIRAACIQGRRSVCGKILKVLPDGLVVDSGYTNLLRTPLARNWLASGTVTAIKAANLVEANQPDAVCIGLIFLTDLPKSRGPKPKLYDYVLIEGYPSGEYTYASVGEVHRTVRKFSTSLEAAIKWKLNQPAK